MQIFRPKEYYISGHDSSTDDPFIKLKTSGLDLIIKYINHKYKTNIEHLYIELPDPRHAPDNFNYAEKVAQLKPHITDCQRTLGDYRKAFIMQGEHHAVFIVYIRESGKEIILYSDSLGSDPKLAEQLHEHLRIPIYINLDQRQADNYSCAIDAIVLGRDITKKDSGEFWINNIIDLLERKLETPTEKYNIIKLPNELLKTSQRSTFLNSHLDKKRQDVIVHKDQNLDFFRKRYNKMILDNNLESRLRGNISDYPRVKGIKYSSIIQIQYYIDEIEKSLENPLSSEDRNEFIKTAKLILRSEDNIFTFAKDFLSNRQQDNKYQL